MTMDRRATRNTKDADNEDDDDDDDDAEEVLTAEEKKQREEKAKKIRKLLNHEKQESNEGEEEGKKEDVEETKVKRSRGFGRKMALGLAGIIAREASQKRKEQQKRQKANSWAPPKDADVGI